MTMHRGNTNWDDPAFAGRCNICGQDIDPAFDPYPMLTHVNQHKETHEVHVSVVIQGRIRSSDEAGSGEDFDRED